MNGVVQYVVHPKAPFNEEFVGQSFPAEVKNASPVVILDVICCPAEEEKILNIIVGFISIFVMHYFSA